MRRAISLIDIYHISSKVLSAHGHTRRRSDDTVDYFPSLKTWILRGIFQALQQDNRVFGVLANVLGLSYMQEGLCEVEDRPMRVWIILCLFPNRERFKAD